MDDRFSPIPPEAERALPARGPVARAARFLLRRLPIWPLIDFMIHKRVPVHSGSIWYTMGGIALFFFLVQVVTGILLMVYYQPGQPWGSVQRIAMEVPFGTFIRSLHHWGANLMVVALMLHFFSTFFMKAYRPPRELTWLTGMGLLALTLVLGFSGYLLPWDQLSFFATRVGISEMEKAPLLGTWMADMVRGGDDVTIATLGRFYPLHVVVLPGLLAALLGLHLFLVQVQGVSEPDSFRARPAGQRRYQRFFGEFMVNEIPIWLLQLTLLAFLAALWPRELAPEADPAAAAPDGIKPEWYFLSPFQIMKMFPGNLQILGMALTGLVPLFSLAVPFYDRAVPADARGRLVTRLGVAMLAYVLVFTAWGWLS